MSLKLDREGIFKVRPVSWRVRSFSSSKSIAIGIEFVVLAQLDDANEWQPWDGYEEHRVWGDYFVVKKDGQPNVGTCEQLAASLGWRGSLKAVVANPPPECVVQVTVKSENYKDQTYFKAGWMNPEDYVPTAGGAGADEVDAMEASFGSLLRAAASSKASPPKVAAAKQVAPAAQKASAPPVPDAVAAKQERRGDTVSPEDYGTIPF